MPSKTTAKATSPKTPTASKVRTADRPKPATKATAKSKPHPVTGKAAAKRSSGKDAKPTPQKGTKPAARTPNGATVVSPTPLVNKNGKPRLRPGELQGIVRNFLAKNAKKGEFFTPVQVQQAIDAASAGGVWLALEALTKQGHAVKADDPPQRYKAAPRR